MPSGAHVPVAAIDNSCFKGVPEGIEPDHCHLVPAARVTSAEHVLACAVMTRPVPRPATSRAGGRLSAVFCGLALAGEEVEQLADGGLLAGRPGQREAGLDLVAVAAAVSLLGRVAGLGEVGDDGAGAALGAAQ